MKTIPGLAIVAILIASVSSCQKEMPAPEKVVGMKEVSLKLGIESKTYLNSTSGRVVWGSNEHVQVFTDKKVAYDFASSSKVNEETATFTGTIPEKDTIKYVIYTGKNRAESKINMAIEADGKISGSDLALTKDQKPTTSHSYKNNAAISIMKEGDSCLKNIFGLVKMSFPVYDSEYAQSRIYKVEISSDTLMAGRIKIDYSGDEPVCSEIIKNSVASETITITAKTIDKTVGGIKKTIYEGGDIYCILVPRTYKNFKMKVYSFSHEPENLTDTAGIQCFTIEAAKPFTVKRNAWVDAGTLPYSKPQQKTKCCTPEGLSDAVDGTNVRLFVTRSSDAEKYNFQVYRKALPESGEPSPEDMIASGTVDADKLPYIPDASLTNSTKYWFRVQATSSLFQSSDWASSVFVTGKEDGQFSIETSSLFKEHYDSASGVLSYILKDTLLHTRYENSQSSYFNCKSMTKDGRFILYFCSYNEYRHSETNHHGAIIDLKNDKIYEIPNSNLNAVPFLDTDTDIVYYIHNLKSSGSFYKRELLSDPLKDIYLCAFPSEIYRGDRIRRACTHLTLTSDRKRAFIDARSGNYFYLGMVELASGKFDLWEKIDTNLCHAQICRTNDDLVLCAIDSFTDMDGKTIHTIQNDPDGAYPRIQLMTKSGRRTIRSQVTNYATHENWTEQGDGIYFCSTGVRYHDLNTGTETLICPEKAAHSFLSIDKKYVTCDCQKWGCYYRGCPWAVYFWNIEKQKGVWIHTKTGAVAPDKDHESGLHPDPHPQFVCGDKYIICTMGGKDGNMHLSVTPVEQLKNMTK